MIRKPAAKTSRRSTNAISLLKADHKEALGLFKQFKKIKEKGDATEKSELVKQVCQALTIHSQIEEELFYPAVREAIDADSLMDEATVEHQGAKDLIAQLESMDPGDELYDAKVTVLGENIKHHVNEEQEEMFPKVTKAKMDLKTLGEEMRKRKQELQDELGINISDDESQARNAQEPAHLR